MRTAACRTMASVGAVVFGLSLLVTSAGCGSTATNDSGSGGAGGDTSTGGSTSAGGAGGSGAAGGAGGAGGAMGNCGDKNCTEEQICRTCNADYGGKEYSCDPLPPVPGAGEFLCWSALCKVGQYCSMRMSPWCGGAVSEVACHDLDPACVVDGQTCSCLGPPECALGCSVDADGNWSVQTKDLCEV